MTNFPFSLPLSSETQLSKAILFKVSRYCFALPISAVLKVVNFPPEFRTTLNEVGFVDLGDRAIALLDLNQKVNSSEAPVQEKARFLTIVQLSDKELCAIPVAEPPTLSEIDLADARELPSSAATPPFNLASHVVVWDSQEPPLEVFLLDLQKLSQSRV